MVESTEYSVMEAHMNAGQFIQPVGHVLPIAVSDKPTLIGLPSLYLTLYAAHIRLMASILMGDSELRARLSSYEPPPGLKLTLEYTDLGGGTHSQRFSVEPGFFRLSPIPKEGGWGDAVHGEVRIIPVP